jgi:Flp pilus assembly protein TadB
MTLTATTSLGAGWLALMATGAMLDAATQRARRPRLPSTPSTARITSRRWVAVVGGALAAARQRRLARCAPPPSTVAEWCDAITRRLRSGETLRQVLTTERPAHTGLSARTEPLRRALGRGTSVADAVAASTSASAPTALDLVWSVLALTSDYGGSAATPIDRAASALRLRSADLDERSAQSAQARLSAHVLTAVPLLVLALLVATDADVRLIVSQPSGWSLVSAGVVLNLCGWSWMRHIVTRQLT